MNYVTMATTGTAQDFGDNDIAKGANGAGCASPTRGIMDDGDSAGSNIVFLILQQQDNQHRFLVLNPKQGEE